MGSRIAAKIAGSTGASSGSPGTETVTSVSVVDGDGTSGSVTNPTTTPAITINLDMSNVPASEAISANDLMPLFQNVLTLVSGGTVSVNGNYTYRGEDTGYPYYNEDGQTSDPTSTSAISVFSSGGGLKAVVGGTAVYYRSAQTIDNYADIFDALQDLVVVNGANPVPTVTQAQQLFTTNAETEGAVIGGTVGTTDNAVPRADGTGGLTLQGSVVQIADTTGAITGCRTVALSGSTSGSVTLAVPAVAGSNTITWPAGTTDFSATGGSGQVVKQASAGGAFTVGPVAVGDVSGFGTGVATALAVNVGSAGAPVVLNGAGGTPSSITLTNATGYTAANLPSAIDAVKIANGNVSNTEFQYLDGVTSAIQTQLDGKFASASMLRSYLASDVVYNNDDTLDDTALSVTVVSGGIYDIELTIYATSDVRALQLDFAGTATASNFLGDWASFDVTDPAAADGLFVSDPPTAFLSGTQAGIPDSQYKFKGSFEVSSGGTFLVRGAQTSAHGSNTTIKRGSTLILTKMN